MKALKVITSIFLTVVLTLVLAFGAVWHHTELFNRAGEPTAGSTETVTPSGGTWSGNPISSFAICTTAQSENWQSRYLLKATSQSDNYTVSVNVKTATNGSEGVDGEFRDYGIYPTYVDGNNFVLFYIRYLLDKDGTRILGFLGVNDRSNGVDHWGALIWSDTGDFAEMLGGNRQYNSTQDTVLKAVRTADTYEVYFNGVLLSTYVSTTGNAAIQNSKVGLYASGWAEGCYFSQFKELNG